MNLDNIAMILAILAICGIDLSKIIYYMYKKLKEDKNRSKTK